MLFRSVSQSRYASLMLNRATQTVRGKPSFVALAPVFEDKETSFINKSCQRFIEKAQKSDSTTRAFSLNGEYITPLPATEDEVEQINKIHTDKGIFSRYFTRETAREDLIKKGELADFDYIHFATHGFVNSQYPDLSGLLLAQEKNSSEDGILYSGEIAALSLRADLVTLSACETALGKKIEGVINGFGGGPSGSVNFINLKIPEYTTGLSTWNSINAGIGVDANMYGFIYSYKTASFTMNMTSLS